MRRENERFTWIQTAKARGLAGGLSFLLDALSPLGPLAAQLLWVIQPLGALFGARAAIGDIAAALEDPDGMEQLRAMLDE